MAQTPPISASWNASSGDWSNGANWDEPNPVLDPQHPLVHYVPGADNNVNIFNEGTNPFTVTYNATQHIWSLAGNETTTLDMVGGALTTDHNSVTGSSINVHAGATLSAAAGTSLTFAGGVIGGTLAGGAITFIEGVFTINAGAVFSAASITFGVSTNGFGSQTTLNTNLTYGGAFTLDDYSGDNGTVHLNGKTFTLTGSVTLGGVIDGPGTLLAKTTGTKVQVAITNGATLEIQGTASQVNYSSSQMSVDGTLLIDSGSTFTVATTAGMTDNGATSGTDPAAQYINNGTFVDDAGGGIARIFGHFTNNGTLSATSGNLLYLGGVNTLGGTLSGAGTIVIGAGTTTLNSTAVTVAGLNLDGGNTGATLTLGNDLSYGGAFAFTNQFDTLNLNGKTLTLTGASNTLADTIQGTGEINVTGTANIAFLSVGYQGTAAEIVDSHAITQSATFSLHGNLAIQSGATYTFTAATDITDNGALIVNLGTIVATVAGTATIAGVFGSSGTITVAAGATLRVSGTDTIAGTVSGAGTFTLGAGAATINATTVSVGTFNIGNGSNATLGADFSDANTFNATFGTVNLAGHTLTLGGTAAFYSETIGGSGTIKVTGTTDFSFASVGSGNQSVTIIDSHAITQGGNALTLVGALQIQSGATYTFTTASDLAGQGTAVITNSGTITDNAAGTSVIDANLTTTGLIAIGSGAALQLSGTDTIGGSVSGAGSLFLVGSNATINTANITTAAVQLGTGTVTLGVDLAYANTFTDNYGTIALGGHLLTLSGNATIFGGTVRGSGGLKLTGASNKLQNAAIGTDNTTGSLAMGGGGTTLIAAGTTIATGTWAIAAVGTTVNLGENLSYGGGFSQTNLTTLNLGANTLTLSGSATFNLGPAGSPVLTGTGKLVTSGTDTLGAFTLGGSVLFRSTGAVNQVGTITLGDSSGGAAQFTNAPGKTWSIAGDYSIVAGNTAAVFNNGGSTLQKTSGTGTSVIGTNFVNLAGTAATITVSSGILNFTGATNNFVADAISGAGTLAIGGGGTSTIGTGTSVTTASWTIAKVGTTVNLGENLTYAGNFSQTNQTTLNLGANSLTLSGPALFNLGPAGSPIINGTGKLITNGTDSLGAFTLGGAVLLRNNGGVTQTGNITLGDSSNGAAQVTNAAGKSWVLTADIGIVKGSTAALFNTGGGGFSKTGGTGVSTIGVNVINANATTSQIEVASGTLDFAGTVSGAQAFKIDAGRTLQFDSSVATGSAVIFAGAGGTLRLNDAQDFKGAITGFGGGQSLDLASIGYTNPGTTLVYAGSTLTVAAGGKTASLAIGTGYTPTSFHLANDTHGGSLVTYG